MRRFFSVLLKVLLGLGLVVVLAVVGALLALRVPSVQTKLARQAAEVLTRKLGQTVMIGRVNIRPFSSVLLEGVRVLDRRGGELFSIGRADLREKPASTDYIYQFRNVNLVSHLLIMSPITYISFDMATSYHFYSSWVQLRISISTWQFRITFAHRESDYVYQFRHGNFVSLLPVMSLIAQINFDVATLYHFYSV